LSGRVETALAELAGMVTIVLTHAKDVATWVRNLRQEMGLSQIDASAMLFRHGRWVPIDNG
jgi:hypothetical protein